MLASAKTAWKTDEPQSEEIALAFSGVGAYNNAKFKGLR
jgi:hypothetical protein